MVGDWRPRLPGGTPTAQRSGKPAGVRIWQDIGCLLPAGLLLEGAILLGFVRGATLRSYPQVVNDPDPLLLIYGPNAAGLSRFLLAVVASYACYFLALWASRRAPGRFPQVTIFAMALLFSLSLVPMYPVGTQDLIHNIADARTLWRYHASPLTAPPLAYPDAISTQVVAFADEPSYYGPGWYLLMGLPYIAGGDDLIRNIVVHKLFVTLFFFGSAVVLSRIVRAVRPAWALPALVLFTWNPLVLFEVAGNGHNDVVMVFFALVAVWAAVRSRWHLVPVAFVLAVLIKYTLVVLGPVLLLYALKAEGRRVWRPLLLGGAVGLLIMVVVFAPLWEGLDTVRGLRGGLDRWHASFASVLYHRLVLDQPPVQAARLTKVVMLALFGIGYGWLLWRLRGDWHSLLCTSYLVVFWYLLSMAWWFLPWYVLWLLPLSALTLGWSPALTGLVLSCTALLGYAGIAWGRVLWSGDPGFGLEFLRTALIWTAPVLLGVVEALHQVLGTAGARERPLT